MARALSFTDHRRDLGDNLYVYAVVSRRAGGLSIGINLNPDKVCNFDCPYCQVDRTTPGGSPRIDLPRLRAELDDLLGRSRADLWSIPPFDTTAPALRRLVDIAFAGDGEPTSPPEFPAAASLVRAARDAAGLTVPLRLLTNSTLLHRVRVREGLLAFDDLWCKLDAGTETYFRLVDGTRFPFARILKNLKETARRRPIVIQSMFLRLDGKGPDDREIDAYVARLVEISHIDHVQVYTVARKPARPEVSALDNRRLHEIVDRIRGAGFRAEAFGG